MARRHCSYGRCRPASSSAAIRRGKRLSQGGETVSKTVDGSSSLPSRALARFLGCAGQARRVVQMEEHCPRRAEMRVRFPSRRQRSGTIPVSRKARSHRLVGRSAADPHTHAVECLRPQRWGMKQHAVSAHRFIAQLVERPIEAGEVARSSRAETARTQDGAKPNKCRSANPIAAKASPTKQRQGTSGITRPIVVAVGQSRICLLYTSPSPRDS